MKFIFLFITLLTVGCTSHISASHIPRGIHSIYTIMPDDDDCVVTFSKSGEEILIITDEGQYYINSGRYNINIINKYSNFSGSPYDLYPDDKTEIDCTHFPKVTVYDSHYFK